jgi:predicted branched-subunit amino acid permease
MANSGMPRPDTYPDRTMSDSADATSPTETQNNVIMRRAVRDSIPLFIPAVPFALVLGVAITESAMPTAIAWSTNVFIFAGAAQLATVSLAATATWLTLVATAAAINLRHVMYSAALAPRFEDQPRWFRWVGPFVLIDQTFALVSARTELSADTWRRYYLTAGVFFFVLWNIAVIAGMLVGSSIPSEWRLGVAPAVMFAGLVVLGLTNWPGVVAAVTGAAVCFMALSVPNNGGILIGAVAGVTAGYIADVVLDGRNLSTRGFPQ